MSMGVKANDNSSTYGPAERILDARPETASKWKSIKHQRRNV